MTDDWPYPRIVAHRCGGKLAPENTLAGIDCGVQHGHRMIEFDAKLSADQQVFLLHDDSLNRTTNHQGIAGELLWQNLQQIDAGAWYSQAFSGEKLPHLRQVAERCRRYHLYANIEIKPTTGLDSLTGTLVAQAAAEHWQGMALPLLSSFSFQALLAAKEVQPSLPRGYLMHEWNEEWREITAQLACVSLHLNYPLLTSNRIRAIKSAGLRILAYTVNQPEIARELLQQGVDMICTDNIDNIGADFASKLNWDYY